MKIPLVRISKRFQDGKHINTGRAIHPSSTGAETFVLRTISDFTICDSSPGCSSVSFNKLVNIRVSPSSLSCSSKLNPRKALWETPTCRSCRQPRDLLLAAGIWSEVGVLLWDCALNLWDLSLQIGSVWTEINCRTCSCVAENWLWGKHSTCFAMRSVRNKCSEWVW